MFRRLHHAVIVDQHATGTSRTRQTGEDMPKPQEIALLCFQTIPLLKRPDNAKRVSDGQHKADIQTTMAECFFPKRKQFCDTRVFKSKGRSTVGFLPQHLHSLQQVPLPVQNLDIARLYRREMMPIAVKGIQHRNIERIEVGVLRESFDVVALHRRYQLVA